MKSRINWAILIAVLMPVFAVAQSFPPESDKGLEKDGIWVNVAFEGTSTVTTFRARYDYQAEKVFEILSDTANLAKLHKSNYDDSRTLDKAMFDKIVAAKPQSLEELQKILGQTRLNSNHNRSKGSRWTDYTYNNFNFPWPLSNRWTVNSVKVDETGGGDGRYKYEFTLHVGNFKSMKGYWELVPGAKGDSTCEFRGVYRSDPGISLPHFATKLGTKTAMKREYEENKNLLKARHGNK